MRRRTVLAGIITGGIGLAGCTPSHPPAATPPQTAPPAPAAPPPLLPGWEPVALPQAAKRIGRGVLPTTGAYFWQSEREVLFVRPAAHGIFQLSSLAAGSGKERPLPELNQRLRGRLRLNKMRVVSPDRPEGELHLRPSSIYLSTDGRWLLWHGGLEWTAQSLQTGEELRWRQPSPLQNPAVWLHDARYWAELEADARDGRDFLRRVFIHDLHNPLADRTVETPALEAGAVLGFTSEGRLLVHHPSPVAPTEEARFTEVDLGSEQGRLHSYSVRLPRPGSVIETALSPEGSRLAWVLAEAGGPARRTLWLSRPGGESITLVGTAEKIAKDSLRLVRWLPRGDGLSFVAGGSLYKLALPH